MATLTELSSLLNDPTLTSKCNAACLVAASAIIGENSGTSNHANRLLWAKKVFQDPVSQGQLMLRAVLAANNAATLTAINTASDATIQSAVNAAVDVVANGS